MISLGASQELTQKMDFTSVALKNMCACGVVKFLNLYSSSAEAIGAEICSGLLTAVGC